MQAPPGTVRPRKACTVRGDKGRQDADRQHHLEGAARDLARPRALVGEVVTERKCESPATNTTFSMWLSSMNLRARRARRTPSCGRRRRRPDQDSGSARQHDEIQVTPWSGRPAGPASAVQAGPAQWCARSKRRPGTQEHLGRVRRVDQRRTSTSRNERASSM